MDRSVWLSAGRSVSQWDGRSVFLLVFFSLARLLVDKSVVRSAGSSVLWLEPLGTVRILGDPLRSIGTQRDLSGPRRDLKRDSAKNGKKPQVGDISYFPTFRHFSGRSGDNCYHFFISSWVVIFEKVENWLKSGQGDVSEGSPVNRK